MFVHVIMKKVFHSGNSAVMAQSQKGRKIGQRLKIQCVCVSECVCVSL